MFQGGSGVACDDAGKKFSNYWDSKGVIVVPATSGCPTGMALPAGKDAEPIGGLVPCLPTGKTFGDLAGPGGTPSDIQDAMQACSQQAVNTREKILLGGQPIQKEELTITTSPAPIVSNQPKDVTASGSFTLSIDINMATLPNGSLMRVIGQGDHPGHPALWLFPAGTGGNTWFKLHIGSSEIALNTHKTPPTYNTYYNITAIYNGTTRQAFLYHNGVLAGSAVMAVGFAPPTPSTFGWNQQNLTAPTVKVRNAYWFNTTLTPNQVAMIANSAPLTNSSMSSTYMMEGSPFVLSGYGGPGPNWRLILILILLVILLWIVAQKI